MQVTKVYKSDNVSIRTTLQVMGMLQGTVI